MITITAAIVREISTKEKPELVAPLVAAMNEFFPKFDITTEKRVEQCLAQLAHESDGFHTLEEYASGDAYDTRTDLGNTKAKDGDGRKYKGRGPIQTTGRANYERAQKRMAKLGIVVDLINHPEQLATPRYGILAACIYWQDKKLNALADRDDVEGITRRINGGVNGLDDRKRYLKRLRILIKSADPTNDTIGPGSDPDAIRSLQKLLEEKKYQPGRPDGKWGKLTRDAVLALKADNGLDTSHETITFAEAAAAPERVLESRKDATVADLRAEGSETVKGADKTQIAGTIATAVPVAGYGVKTLIGEDGSGGVLGKAEEYSGYWHRVQGLLEPFAGFTTWISDNLWVVLPAIGGVAIYFGYRVKKKRLEDFKAGKVQ